MYKDGSDAQQEGETPTKRRKVQFAPESTEEAKLDAPPSAEEGEAVSSQQMSRALIAEQTVEMAKSFQPTGTDLSSANVKTKVPFLLHGSLREY